MGYHPISLYSQQITVFFFFLIIRPPTRSTLFPYTTLFRSEGDRVRLSGEGEPGVNGGPPGDLYVQVHIKPHPVFQRDHDDLHCEMPISFSTAALGGDRSEEHTSELQSLTNLVCRLLLEKKK